MKKYPLTAVDMDGTLLMPDKSVHPQTIRDIAEAVERGLEVVYCTGRSIPEMRQTVKLLPQIRYGVCESGALVYDFLEDRPIVCRRMDQNQVLQIVRVSDQYDGMLQFLAERESYVRRDQVTHMADYHMGAYQPTFLQMTVHVPDMRAEALRHTGIPKVNIYFRSEADRDRGYEELKHLPLTFVYNEKTALEMTPRGVTKASGLEVLTAHLGRTMADTVGIGDGGNDIEMLKAVGLPVAMANADDEVKAAARIVTGSNEENGVGQVLRRILADGFQRV